MGKENAPKVQRLADKNHVAHTPIRCLDYVILHELLHLKVRHHNKDYIALLDKYMPFWQEVRKELNDFVLMPMK